MRRYGLRKAAYGSANVYIALCSALVILWSSSGAGQESIRATSTGMQLSCMLIANESLECDYRLDHSAPIKEIVATFAEHPLPTPRMRVRAEDATTAILFLVDTSDPGRASTVARSVQHLRRLIDAGRPNHRFGLATFDADLRLLAPLGSTQVETAEVLGQIEAKGKTTELYRNALSAITFAFGVQRRPESSNLNVRRTRRRSRLLS